MKLKTLVNTTALICLVTSTSASGAVSFAVNFNNNDGAGAQTGSSSFGATWTDINSSADDLSAGLLNVGLNGTTATMDLTAPGWWQAGSWEGTNGPNAEISVFRSYLNDGGIDIRLNGLSTWLASENATGYIVTLFASTDNGTIFDDATVNGTTVSIPVGGNGAWDGTAEDPNGNSDAGSRGIGTSGIFTTDTLDISLPPFVARPTRASLAGFQITAVPEPSSFLLTTLGLATCLVRRRR